MSATSTHNFPERGLRSGSRHNLLVRTFNAALSTGFITRLLLTTHVNHTNIDHQELYKLIKLIAKINDLQCQVTPVAYDAVLSIDREIRAC